MEILTAYVRENAKRKEDGRAEPGQKHGVDQDIQAILTVLGRRATQ